MDVYGDINFDEDITYIYKYHIIDQQCFIVEITNSVLHLALYF